ncbi:hypothetical protein B0H16DRAFT_1316716 [Mycena metata]|uniref:Uncharacterized protein n=1 Tax=Mycena metata TaxID=1033252 RepID=A0AAD7NBF0_9AGAR|nr:hypothetical protein B0H16DRAFT_1316716 [Mycena metata]
MRQKEQTEDDNKLRLALSNLRYAACTEEDIVFLKSRVAGCRPGDPRLDSAEFRNVSIITSWNSQKDVINRLGARKFAVDTAQELATFYSIDTISPRVVDKSKWKTCEQSAIKVIGQRLQNKLWDAMPSANSEMMPGKLALCIGMPLLLRTNDATELCMTKGQESVVVGWDESVGPRQQRVLDTLFVRLENLPKPVQIPGLPENVVPLIRGSVHTTVLLEDDTLLSITREQITSLLNFSITDYTSQGKSRPKNPVDLTNCKDHRAYYVALSRATTAEGTIILQDFPTSKMTCGMSGHLRQELRELEVLDEITRLRVEGKLPSSVAGIYRRKLLRSFQIWKGASSEPSHFHESMRYNEQLDGTTLNNTDYAEWKPSGTSLVKRNANSAVEDALGPAAKGNKKRKTANTKPTTGLTGGIQTQTALVTRPIGMVWDAADYSCAYDTTLGILANIWLHNPDLWSERFCTIGPYFLYWTLLLRRSREFQLPLEAARDSMRARMHTARPIDFPYGPNGTSIDRIARIILPETTHATGQQWCPTCGYQDSDVHHLLEPYLCTAVSGAQLTAYPGGYPVSEWMKSYLSSTTSRCPACSQNAQRVRLQMRYKVTTVPPIMIITVDCGKTLFSRSLHFDVDGTMVVSRLRGIIYSGSAHFTSRYVSAHGSVWFNDGMTTARNCVEEGHIDSMDLHSLAHARGKVAIVLIYALDQ